MAIATRNLYLVLKARDEASRVIRGFGRELTRANALARAEQLRNAAGIATLRAAELEAAGAAQKDIDQQRLLARQLRSQAQEIERNHRSLLRLANSMQTLSATLITVGSGLVLIGGATIAGLAKATQISVEYARQVSLTMTQVDGFKTSLSELSQVGLDVAKNVAVPFEEIQPELYDIFSSTNANVAQAKILLEGFAKTAVAGQVSLQDATRGTIPILNAFKIPLDKVNDILDIQFQLVRKGVGTYGEFSKVFGRVVPSATRAGQNFQTVAAMLAFLTRNGLSAAMASTASARALDAISNPKSVHNMEELGIKVRDVKGNMLPLVDILQNLQKYLLKLPNKDRVSALVDLFKGAGGTIQARRFLDQVLLKPGQLDDFIGFLGDMNQSTGQFQKAYATMSDTVSAKTQLLKNKLKVAAIALGEGVTPAFIVILTYIGKVIDAFNNLDPATKKWISIALLLGAITTVVAGVFLVFLGALAGIAAAVITAGSGFFVLVGAVVALVSGMLTLVGVIGVAWQRSKDFRDAMLDAGRRIKEIWLTVIVPTALAIRDAFVQKVIPAVRDFIIMLRDKVLPVARQVRDKIYNELLPALKELGNNIKDRAADAFAYLSWVIHNLVIPAIEEATNFYKNHKQTIDEIIVVVVFLIKWLLKIVVVILFVAAIVGGTIVVGAFLLFIELIKLVGAGLTITIEIIKGIIHWFSSLGDNGHISAKKVKDAFADMVQFLKSIPAQIIAAIGDTSTLLLHAGENLIEGLIQGIKNKLSALGDIVGLAAQNIKDHFPHSPAKKGPLAGYGGMYYAGQTIMRQLAQGMSSVSTTASDSAVGIRNVAAFLTQSPTYQQRPQVNQTINIHTQEIDPVKHSTELGFLLGAR